jgi:hypothetical protein
MINACASRCNISCTTARRDEGAVPQARRGGQRTPVGSSRSAVPHIRFAMVIAAMSVDPVWAPSHHSLSSAAFITVTAESNFRYTQDSKKGWRGIWIRSWPRRGRCQGIRPLARSPRSGFIPSAALIQFCCRSKNRVFTSSEKADFALSPHSAALARQNSAAGNTTLTPCLVRKV